MCVVPLDGSERFADPCPEHAGNLSQRLEDIFFPCDLHLLLVEDVAGTAVRGAQAQHVLAAHPGHRPVEDRRIAVRSHTSRAICGVSLACAGWPIKPGTAWMRSSDTRLRNGDCSS